MFFHFLIEIFLQFIFNFSLLLRNSVLLFVCIIAGVLYSCTTIIESNKLNYNDRTDTCIS